MEEEVLRFTIVIKGSGKEKCELMPKIDDWVVEVEWSITENVAEFVIEISKITAAPYAEFYADMEMWVVGGNIERLRKSVKGPSTMIKIPTKLAELSEIQYENSMDLAGELIHKELSCEVRLSPFVHLKKSIATNLDIINRNHVDVLIDHISTLQYSGDYDMFFDIVVTSGNTSVKAHKCILAARLPNFVSRITEPLPRRPQDNLEEIEIDSSAEAGLHQMISYVYSNVYRRDLISLGKLALTAKAMDSRHLKLTILRTFLKEVTVQTVLYAIFFTDWYGESRHRKQALMYMLDHFEEVQATAGWNHLQVIFTCFLLRDDAVSEIVKEDILKISLKLHSKMFYTSSGTE